MELTTLKRLRKIVPGTIFLFFCIPIYLYVTHNLFSFDDALKFTTGSLGAALAFVIGTLFSGLKIRSLRNKKSLEQINNNIKAKLIEHGLTTAQDPAKIEKIKASKQLMHIFYHFVDNDASLKEKSKLVKDNGLTWTSTADLAILGCVFCWLYFILILVLGAEPLFFIAGLLIGILGLISGAVLHPMAAKEHINLSNEQLGFIFTNYKKELQERVTALFS